MTAIVRDDTLAVIKGIAGDVQVTNSARGGTEMTVILTITQIHDLASAAKKSRGMDPNSRDLGEIGRSLDRVQEFDDIDPDY